MPSSLSDPGFGLWTGTAVDDPSAVVAAGLPTAPLRGHRHDRQADTTTLIIPMVLGFGSGTAVS